MKNMVNPVHEDSWNLRLDALLRRSNFINETLSGTSQVMFHSLGESDSVSSRIDRENWSCKVVYIPIARWCVCNMQYIATTWLA